MSGPIMRFAGLAAMAVCAALACPSRTLANDRFPCASDEASPPLVYISGSDSTKAVVEIADGTGKQASASELTLKPGGNWENFRYEDARHIFVGGNGKAVLLMQGKSYFCKYVDTPAPRQEQPAAAELPRASRVELGRGGLDIVEQDDAHRESLGFGADKAQVVIELTSALGPPTAETTNEECGAGPMSFRRFGPLTINFSKRRWVGWTLDKGKGAPRTSVPVTLLDGITIGSPTAKLAGRRDYFRDSTLGNEFMAEGISGLSTGKDKLATIQSLWAGTTCFFR